MDKEVKNPINHSVSEENKVENATKAPDKEAIIQKVKEKTVELIENGEYKKPKARTSTYNPPQILLPKDDSEETKKKYLGFGKFEREANKARHIKAIFAGLSLAFIVSGLLVILSKLEIININYWITIAIAICSFFVAWTPVFIMCRFNLEKTAKQLDQRFSLKEKSQSTIETLRNDSEMGVLLRNDLRKEIEKIGASELKAHKFIWIYASVFIISCALLLTGIIIPKEHVDNLTRPPVTNTESDYFVLSEENEAKLNELKASVQNSSMVEDAKSEIVTEIDNLLKLLKNVRMLKKDAVNTAKLTADKIDTITMETGSQHELYTALKKHDSVYTREFARLLSKFSWEKHLIKRMEVQSLFVHKDEGAEVPDLEQMKKDTIKALNDASTHMLLALESADVPSTDPLYELLYKFTTENDPSNKEAKGEGLYGTKEIASEMESLSYRWAQKRIEALFSILGEDIFRELDLQNQNYSVGYGAANKIRSMFGIPKKDIEDNSKEEKEEDEEEKTPPEGADGGGGGGLTFAGDDAVYDKDKLSHVTYGDVINTYYMLMQSTDYTPEQKAAIQKYFETLFVGLEEKDEG